jgi:hypothetical protein
VGGVSGRPAQETKRSDPLPCLLPRRWKAPWSVGSAATFAGCRKSAGLGRFVQRVWQVSSSTCGAPTTSGCPLEERGGERRRRTPSVRTRLRPARQQRDHRSSRTRPSLGPETRARQTPLNSVRSKAGRGGAVGLVSRSGKPGQPGGTGTGTGTTRTNARLAVCHRPRKGERVMDKKRKKVMAFVPARRSESPGLVARTSECSCRSRQAVSGPKYARTQRSQKSGGASERGPSSAR